MKNTILILAIALSSFMSVVAQPNQTSRGAQNSFEDKSTDRLEYLTIVLDLTSEQTVKIKSLQQKHAEDMKVIKDQYKPIMDKMRAELKATREAAGENDATVKDKMKAIHAKYEPQLEPMKKQMAAEKDKFDNSLIGILDKNQSEKYLKLKALKEANKAAHKANFKNGQCEDGKGKFDKPQLKEKQIEEK